MKLATERTKKAKVVASPQVTTKSLLASSKLNKKRVVATTTSSNREAKRQHAKVNYKCNNSGLLINAELLTPEDYEAFRVGRSNKKVMKRISFIMKNNIGYSKNQLKEAGKVMKSTAKKYSDADRIKASKIVARLGKYPNLVCLEDIASKLQRVS